MSSITNCINEAMQRRLLPTIQVFAKGLHDKQTGFGHVLEAGPYTIKVFSFEEGIHTRGRVQVFVTIPEAEWPVQVLEYTGWTSDNRNADPAHIQNVDAIFDRIWAKVKVQKDAELAEKQAEASRLAELEKARQMKAKAAVASFDAAAALGL